MAESFFAESENFRVELNSDLGRQADAEMLVGQAETMRLRLAEYWLSRQLPRWSRPAIVRVRQGGSSGSSQFRLERGEAFDWRVEVLARDLDNAVSDVLPHEVTHLVLYSHFRSKIPRWADEGCAGACESTAERRVLMRGRERRWMPLQKILLAKEYPAEPAQMLQFYAQSAALVEVLLDRGGPEKLITLMEQVDSGAGYPDVFRRLYSLSVGDAEELAENRMRQVVAGKVMAVQQPQFHLVTVTMFTQRGCQSCGEAYRDINNGFFGNLPVQFEYHDVGRRGWPKGINAVPDFGIGREHFGRKYNRAELKQWIAARCGGAQQRPRPFEQVSPSSAAETDSGTAGVAPSPAAAASVTEIEWSEITVLALASGDTPAAAGLLKGPLKRLLQDHSKGRASLEVIAERTHPRRYGAVVESLGVSPSPIFVVFMVRKSVDVGFFKGVVLKKVEREIKAAVDASSLHCGVEAVFERNHDEHWAPVMQAVLTPEVPQSGVPPPGGASSVVALVMGLLGSMKLCRVGRNLAERRTQSILNEAEAAADPHAEPAAVSDIFRN